MTRPRSASGCVAVRRRCWSAWSAAALVLSGCSVYDAPLPGGADTGDNPITVTVMFRDVLDLVPQSTVKVNDVTVGKVNEGRAQGLRRRGHRSRCPATSSCRTTPAPRSGRPACSARSSSAQRARDDRARGKLANGDVIALDRTGRNPEVEEVLGALSLLLNGGGVGQLKTIFSELNNALEGREPEVRSVLTQLRVFMGQLDENKAPSSPPIENTQPPGAWRSAATTARSRPHSTTSRRAATRSTASAPTWSRCSRR